MGGGELTGRGERMGGGELTGRGELIGYGAVIGAGCDKGRGPRNGPSGGAGLPIAGTYAQ